MRVLCLIFFLHDIVLDIAVGAFISSSSMDGSEIALSISNVHAIKLNIKTMVNLRLLVMFVERIWSDGKVSKSKTFCH